MNVALEYLVFKIDNVLKIEHFLVLHPAVSVKTQSKYFLVQIGLLSVLM